VRLREVVHLAYSLAEADAEGPARAERDHRLHRLVPGSLRIGPRVEEAEEPGASVGLEPDRREREPESEGAGRGQEPERRPGHEERRAEHDPDGDDGAEVGLEQDEPAGDPRDEPEGPEELPERPGRRPLGEHSGNPDRERELCELGRLNGEASDGEPAAGAVHGRSREQNEDEEDARAEEKRRREALQGSVVEAREERHPHEPEAREQRLALEVVHRVARSDDRAPGARAVDHDEPEGDERERDEHEQVVLELPLVRGARAGSHRRGVGAGHGPPSRSTASRKWVPRSSKFSNWS
jgi:hypothetical protein